MNRIVLAITFLLATSSLASAQWEQRTEDLRGLTGVRLIVMFGRAEALDEAQRPEVLKTLEADATLKLQEAGIRLFRTADELERSGHPTLVLVVTLDKPNGYVYPLVAEVKLLQKVRLLRDPSIETDAVSWRLTGVAFSHGEGLPKFEMKQVFQTSASLIDRFIEAYQSVNPKKSANRTVRP